MDDRVTPELLGRLLDEQGGALALYAAQWTEAADDCVQETLIEAWRHLDQLRAPERFDAWLNGICRNICLRWQRAR